MIHAFILLWPTHFNCNHEDDSTPDGHGKLSPRPHAPLLAAFEILHSQSVKGMNEHGQTLLHLLCVASLEKQMAPTLKQMLPHFPDALLDTVTTGGERGKGWPALCMLCLAVKDRSATADRLLMLQMLLEHKADVNVQVTPSKSNALITASGNGNYKACELLLADSRLDLEHQNCRDKNAANVVPKNHVDLQRLFTQKGLQPNPDADSSSRLVIAYISLLRMNGSRYTILRCWLTASNTYIKFYIFGYSILWLLYLCATSICLMFFVYVP